MSFWALCGVEIRNLDALRQACKEHDLDYTEGKGTRSGATTVANITSHSVRGSIAVVQKGEVYDLLMDQDARYNPLVNRFGVGLDALVQSYTRYAQEAVVNEYGGSVQEVWTDRETDELVLRVAVGG